MLGCRSPTRTGHASEYVNSVKDDGEASGPEEVEERLDLRDAVTSGRHFHRLAGIE